MKLYFGPTLIVKDLDDKILSIGSRIRECRGKATQKEFAKVVGLEVPTLSILENSRRLPDLKTLLRISEVTGKPLDWFVEKSPESEFWADFKDLVHGFKEDGMDVNSAVIEAMRMVAPQVALESPVAPPLSIHEAFLKVRNARIALEEAEEHLGRMLGATKETSQESAVLGGEL